MRILGLSANHHESAAVLVVDGHPVAAAKESHFTKIPFDASLPLRAAHSCLARANTTGPELDRIVFYEKPLRKFERILATSLRPFPRGGRNFAREVSHWLGDKLWLKGRLCEEFGVSKGTIRFVDHLSSHAACAFYQSPFERAAILIADDVGEWASTAIFRGSETGLELLMEVELPHSLGLAVTAFSQFLGLASVAGNELIHELASHGTPCFQNDVAEIIDVGSDGSPQIGTESLNLYSGGDCLWTPQMEERFGPARQPGAPLQMAPGDSRDADLAASLQAVLQMRIERCAEVACEKAGESDLCFGGTLALHSAVNRTLLESQAVNRLYIPAEPCDAGGALGAAWLVQCTDGNSPPPHCAPPVRSRNGSTGTPENGAASPRGKASSEYGGLFLGESPGFLNDESESTGEQTPSALLPTIAAGSCVAWVRGPLEFSSASFHNRIVLADPTGERAAPEMLGTLQRTDEFLSCRIAIPEEMLHEYVNCSEYAAGPSRLAQLQLPAKPALRALAPSAIPPNGCVRVQTVAQSEDPDLHALLLEYGQLNGAPVLLVETFCLRDSVVPRSDRDALEAFQRSTLAALLVEDRLYTEEPV